MGKNKISIEKIENKEKRLITFSKRRNGLFKKAADLCVLCNAQIAIITFSPAGKSFSFGHSSVDNVLNHFCNEKTPDPHHQSSTLLNLIREHKTTTKNEQKGQQDQLWWDKIQVDEIDSMVELKKVKNGLEKVKENLLKRLGEIAMARRASTIDSTSTEETVVQNDANVRSFLTNLVDDTTGNNVRSDPCRLQL